MTDQRLCPNCSTMLDWLYRDDGILAYFCTECGGWFSLAHLRYYANLEYAPQPK